VAAITALGVARAWLLLVVFGLPHDPGHIALLFVALGAFGLLPIGPTASPAGALAAVGAEQVAAATALGLAISGTTIIAVLAYAAAASARRAAARRAKIRRSGGRQRVESHGSVLASVVPLFLEPLRPGGFRTQMAGQDSNLGLLSERALWERAQEGDPAAREQLVHRYLPLARQLATRYAGRGRPLEDLIQVANLGLVKAVDRYRLDRGAAFSSYAVPTIVGELRRHFRDVGWAVHVPRSVQERVLKIGRATERLSANSGRTPTVVELAQATGELPEDVVDALSAGHAYEADSLDEPSSVGDGESAARGDRMGEDDPGFERVEDWQAIAPAIEELSDRDRLVLRLRFVEDLTQSQIAEQVSVSQMQVSRILRRCISTISDHARKGLDGPNDKPAKRAIAG
jgi:RNA polymerase sigma-B factor